MKWANPDKQIRRKQWIAMRAPPGRRVPEAVKWCRENGSDSKFYNHYTNTRWWFENPDDAILFALWWS